MTTTMLYNVIKIHAILYRELSIITGKATEGKLSSTASLSNQLICSSYPGASVYA
jgi:hypothetical protein